MSVGSSSPLDRNRNNILRELYKQSSGSAGGATEAQQITMVGLLTQLLNEDNSDFEWNMVEDSAGDLFLLRQTLDDAGNIISDYVDADGAAASPVAPTKFISPNNLLSSILTELQLKADLTETQPVSLTASPLPTGASTEATLVELRDKLNSLGIKASADSAPVVLSTEQEVILKGIDTVLDNIKLDTANLDVALSTRATETTLSTLDGRFAPVTRTPSLSTVNGAATTSVTAGARSVSFFNAGNNDVTVAGGTLESGLSVTFTAGGEDDTLAAIPYVTIAASKLVITTIV